MRTLAKHTSLVYAFASLPGSVVASGSYDRTVRVWDRGEEWPDACACGGLDADLCPGGRGGLVASGSLDKMVWVWEEGIGRLLRTLAGHADKVNTLAGLPGWFGAALTAWANKKICPCDQKIKNIGHETRRTSMPLRARCNDC